LGPQTIYPTIQLSKNSKERAYYVSLSPFCCQELFGFLLSKSPTAKLPLYVKNTSCQAGNLIFFIQ
jgi:hypothetical protein